MKMTPVSSALAMALVAMAFAALAAPAGALPSDRAYELVSPPDTGPITPTAGALGQADGFDCFETNLVTPDGEGVAFASVFGAMDGLTSNGTLSLYESRRGASGWSTESRSATAAQSGSSAGGLCMSRDHEYSTLLTGKAPADQGSLVINGEQASYLRTPQGEYVLVGAGSIGTDVRANVKWIAAAGAHVVFTARTRLEPEAPAGIGPGSGYDFGEAPVNAVYDRTPAGVDVVSVLPGGAAPNPATETTFYRGTSADGASVVFEVEKGDGSATLYVHRSDGQTVPIVTGADAGDHRYAGISSDGGRVVYVEKGPASPPNTIRGSIYAFHPPTETTTAVTTDAEAAVVNVSDGGSAVYFETSEALPGSGQNPLGDTPQSGEPNLYQWDATTNTVRFVATVAATDAEEDGSLTPNLTEWIRTVARPQQNVLAGRMNATSRTTPDGSVFVFEARSNITGYDSAEHVEIYRYDANANELACVSCPSAEPATADAALQRDSVVPIAGLNALARLDNVTDDGRSVFFMTPESLSPQDDNAVVDVYQWEAGDIALISGGQGSLPSLLYGMSPDGRDVFFLTIDRLVPQDVSSVLSIYDARIGGGFQPAQPEPTCGGDACQGVPGVPPTPVSVASTTFNGPSDPKPRRCGRRHVKHKGKSWRKAKRQRKRCRRSPGHHRHLLGGARR